MLDYLPRPRNDCVLVVTKSGHTLFLYHKHYPPRDIGNAESGAQQDPVAHLLRFFFCPIRYATWCLRASYEKVVPIGDIQASYSGSVFVCVNMLFGTINHNPAGSPHRRQHTLVVCVCVCV